MKVLESSNGAGEISGSEVRKRIARLSEAKIPDYSIYQTLRTLARQKRVRAHRVGRELFYQLSADKQAAPATRPATRVPSPKVRPYRPLAKPDGGAIADGAFIASSPKESREGTSERD